MDIFTIFKREFSPIADEWVETNEIIAFEAVSATGFVLARGETKQEAIESALFSEYEAELSV